MSLLWKKQGSLKSRGSEKKFSQKPVPHTSSSTVLCLAQYLSLAIYDATFSNNRYTGKKCPLN